MVWITPSIVASSAREVPRSSRNAETTGVQTNEYPGTAGRVATTAAVAAAAAERDAVTSPLRTDAVIVAATASGATAGASTSAIAAPMAALRAVTSPVQTDAVTVAETASGATAGASTSATAAPMKAVVAPAVETSAATGTTAHGVLITRVPSAPPAAVQDLTKETAGVPRGDSNASTKATAPGVVTFAHPPVSAMVETLTVSG